MAKRNNAIGGALSPTVAPAAPKTFNQFLSGPDPTGAIAAANAKAATMASAGGNPFAPAATANQNLKPLTGPDPSGAIAAANATLPAQPADHPAFTPITSGPDPTGAIAAANRTLFHTLGGPDPSGAIAAANATLPVADGMYDPAAYALWARRKFWMDNAKNRGDDTANYGAGPQRTMAF